MSVTIKITNFPDSNIIEKTTLLQDIAAEVNIIPVVNTQNFTEACTCYLGTLGSEAHEILAVAGYSSPNNLAIVGYTQKPHKAGETLTRLFGDSIHIYRAENTNGLQPEDSAFQFYASVAIDMDQLETVYIDPLGSDLFWYKYTFYNNYSQSETNLADSRSARGNSVRYASIDDVRQESGFKNAPYVTDTMIDAKLSAAQAEIDAALGGYYTIPFAEPINPFIRDITRRLAAGLLLLEQFGAYDTMNTNNGQSKVDGARTDYKDLMSGSKVLKDAAGNSMASTGGGSSEGGSTGTGGKGFRGWPNNSTAGAGGGDFMFRVTDKF